MYMDKLLIANCMFFFIWFSFITNLLMKPSKTKIYSRVRTVGRSVTQLNLKSLNLFLYSEEEGFVGWMMVSV